MTIFFKKHVFIAMSFFVLSMLFLSMYPAQAQSFTALPSIQKEEEEHGDDGEGKNDEEGDHEEGSGDEEGSEDEGKGSDEEEIDDELLENWESPYSAPEALLAAFQLAEKEGTCWELMNAKLNLLVDETHYWAGRAQPGSQGEAMIQRILTVLQNFQVEMGEERLDLEKRGGDAESCEDNEDLKNIQEPLEKFKRFMRQAGYLIDTGEEFELTDELVGERCEEAEEGIEKLGENIDHLTEKLTERVEEGDVEGLSNAKELLNMAQLNYGNAVSLFSGIAELKDLEEKVHQCTGALNETMMGLHLFREARSFHQGKEEDHSNGVEEIDAHIKMFLDIIAQKRLEALSRSSENREAILAVLAEAEEALGEVQRDFALIKYQDNPDIENFSERLNDIKDKFKPVIDALENSEEEDLSKKDRRLSAKNLLKKARKQMSSLNDLLEEKEDDVDTDEEENLFQFVEQTTLLDAENARDTARAFRQERQFSKTQLYSLLTLETIQSGKELLQEITE